MVDPQQSSNQIDPRGWNPHNQARHLLVFQRCEPPRTGRLPVRSVKSGRAEGQQRTKEAQLRRSLQQIRDAIDAYKRASDEGRIVRSADQRVATPSAQHASWTSAYSGLRANSNAASTSWANAGESGSSSRT